MLEVILCVVPFSLEQDNIATCSKYAFELEPIVIVYGKLKGK